MLFADFERYFSAARIQRYLQATNNSQERSVELYRANLKLAQAFHPLLGILEVVLRNGLNDVLVTFFGDQDWIQSQANGFMVDPTIPKDNRYLKNCVNKAQKQISAAGGTVTSGKIIAEQTFGFWTELFELNYYKLLLGRPIQVFKNLPAGGNRILVKDELHNVRLFRNRISHNEPICFAGSNIDLSLAKDTHRSIKDLLTWIDPELDNWIQQIDKIDEIISAAEAI